MRFLTAILAGLVCAVAAATAINMPYSALATSDVEGIRDQKPRPRPFAGPRSEVSETHRGVKASRDRNDNRGDDGDSQRSDDTGQDSGQQNDPDKNGDKIEPPTEGSADSPTPQRVIIRVNRHETVAGRIEMEDREVIVVRDRAGKIHSFAKARVLQIVRLVEPEENRRGRIILNDGREQEGIIIEDGFEHVVVEIEGIRARFPREVVNRVVLEPTFEERYAMFKASLTRDNPNRHLAFARWLFDQRRYDLAKEELDDLLSYASVPEARKLLTVVDAQLTLEEAKKKREAEGQADREPSERPRPRPSPDRGLAPEIISGDAVNLMRVYEIDFNRPPRVMVEAETIRKLIESYGTDPQIPVGASERTALFRADPVEIVRLMFDLRAREFYPEVRVLSEPYALNLFRQRVHNAWLIQNCATSQCHGGRDSNAGRFYLYNRGYREDRVRMTNLLVLDRLVVDERWPLVNYEEPIMSMIVQYALPRHEARIPHPDVPGWKPVFRRSTNDRLLRDTLDWINAMMKPRPEYPVEYVPCGMNPDEPRSPARRVSPGGRPGGQGGSADGSPPWGFDSPLDDDRSDDDGRPPR